MVVRVYFISLKITKNKYINYIIIKICNKQIYKLYFRFMVDNL